MGLRELTPEKAARSAIVRTGQSLRGFLEKEQWEFFSRIAPTVSELTLNREAARMILDNRQEIITWLHGLPYYYETERQIFVHAGIGERCPMRWQELTDSARIPRPADPVERAGSRRARQGRPACVQL